MSRGGQVHTPEGRPDVAKNTVIVSVTGNIKGLQTAMGGAESALGKMGMVAGVAAAAAAAAVVAIGTKSIRSASQLEQAMGGMESVFKDSAGQMEQWANAAAGSVGLAKSEYAGLATILGSQLKNMGVSTDQLAGQTDSLVRMGADLAAQFGGSTSDAVSALSSLLRGERDPIEAYGVSINEAAVKAKMAEMGLSGLSGEAEKNAKLQATLALLTQQTADAQGAFARESTTLAGAQQRLAAGTENLYATLGTALLPAATAVTAALGQLINTVSTSDAFASLTASLTNASNSFADFVFGLLNGTSSLDFSAILAGLVPGLIAGIQKAAAWLGAGGLAPIIEGINSSREALLQGFLSVVPALAEGLIAGLPALASAVLSLITGLITLIVQNAPQILAAGVSLFQGLIQALVVILPQLLTMILGLLPSIITSIVSMIPSLLATALTLFMSLVEALVTVVPQLLIALVQALPQIVNTLMGMLPTLIDSALELFLGLIEGLLIAIPQLLIAILNALPKIVSTLISMIPRLIDAAVRLFTGLVEAIPRVLPQLLGALIGLAPALVGAVISLVPQLIRAGIDLIGGLVKGLWNAAGSVGAALLEIAKDALGGFMDFFGIKSPSRKMMAQGKYLMQGLAGGINKNLGLVDNAMGHLNTSVETGFTPTIATPDMAFASAQAGGHRPVAPVYQVTVSTLNATAETGRVIVESIRDYENAGGRL